MKKTILCVLVLALCGLAAAQMFHKDKTGPDARMILAKDMAWTPAPPALPAGAKITVLEGDPMKSGQFVIRLKMPNGYKVPPHWHPTTEQITVLSGTFVVGMGDKWDPTMMTAVAPGGYMTMAAKNHHYGTAKGETVVQIASNGPFAITYVNPSDDPSKKMAAATPAPAAGKKK